MDDEGPGSSQSIPADEASGDSCFFVSRGKTFFHGKNATHEFADFTMKIVGEIHPSESGGGGEGMWLFSCMGYSFSQQIIKQIPLASSDFDSRQKILNSLRAVFPNGTLSLGESASNKIVAKYFTHLKQKYVNSVNEDESLKRICYQTDSLGRQSHSYWLLSPEVHIDNGFVLSEEERVFFTNKDLSSFTTNFNKQLLNFAHLQNFFRRYLELTPTTFHSNAVAFKMATAFTITRLLRSTASKSQTGEAWGESNIGLIFSEHKNVGKSLTLDVLSKGEGVPYRTHPLILSGGNQTTAGTSDKKILEMLSATTLVVFIDDPAISEQMGEFLNQVQGGLYQGSSKGGMMAPKGSLLLCANDKEVERVSGRVIRFNYVKDVLKAEEFSNEKELMALMESNKGAFIAWILKFLPLWEEVQEFLQPLITVLVKTVPNQQPRWIKGVALTALAYGLLHCSVGVKPDIQAALSSVTEGCKKEEKICQIPVITRLQSGLMQYMKTKRNTLMYLNPNVTIRMENGQMDPAIAIRMTVMDSIHDVERSEVKSLVGDKGYNQVCAFGKNEEATLKDLKEKKTKKHLVVSGKAFKLPKRLLADQFIKRIDHALGLCSDMPVETAEQGQDTEESVDAETASVDAEPVQDTEESVDADLESEILLIESNLQTKTEEFLTKISANEDGQMDTHPKMTSFLKDLTPRTKSQYMQYTPRRRAAFELGISAAKNLLNAKEVQDQDNMELVYNEDGDLSLEVTPEQGNAKRTASKKLNFPDGAVGILQPSDPVSKGTKRKRMEKGPEDSSKRPKTKSKKTNKEPCESCGLKSPKGYKAVQVIWVQCDTCHKWFHNVCVGLPEKEELKQVHWYCITCNLT